jgi:hypothetical protein
MTKSLCESCKDMREVRTARSRLLLWELSVVHAAYPSIRRTRWSGVTAIGRKNRPKELPSDEATPSQDGPVPLHRQLLP